MDHNWLVTAALTATLLITLPSGSAQAFRHLEVGQTIADVTLLTPEGEPCHLADVLGPGATVLAFWAGWSPRSRDALTGLADLAAAYGARGLAAVAINVDGPQCGPDAAPAGPKELALSPGITPLVDANLSLYNALGVVAVPSLVLLDASGRVATLSSGYARSEAQAFARGVAALWTGSDPQRGVVEGSGEYCLIPRRTRAPSRWQ